MGGIGGDQGITQPSFAKEVHIRVFKRNGRKCWTTLELDGLPDFDIKSFTRKMAKKFCCSGSRKGDQLKFSGDVRDGLAEVLVEMKLAEKSSIKIHGF